MSVPRYWREIPQRYRLEGVKCTKCNELYFSRYVICPNCKSRELEKMTCSDHGKVITYTVIHVAPSRFELQTPYVLGLVELEDGIRLTARITDCNLEDVKVGMPVEVTFRRVRESGASGIIKYGYKFRPLIKSASTKKPSKK